MTPLCCLGDAHLPRARPRAEAQAQAQARVEGEARAEGEPEPEPWAWVTLAPTVTHLDGDLVLLRSAVLARGDAVVVGGLEAAHVLLLLRVRVRVRVS